tara:strand:- start:8680 stop:8901 length:222 start_codon:yes stop_codon:yes gene_type:complete
MRCPDCESEEVKVEGEEGDVLIHTLGEVDDSSFFFRCSNGHGFYGSKPEVKDDDHLSPEQITNLFAKVVKGDY